MTSSEVPGATHVPAATEQRMGEAIYGPGYTGPATAEANRYVPTTWGQVDSEFVVSSGQRCRIRNLDLRDVIAAGLMDRLNTLQGVVDKNVKKGQGQPPVDPMKMMMDKRVGLQFADLVDEITCMVVNAPTVHPIPDPKAKRIEDRERKEGLVYVDTISLSDKIDIFSHALGGLRQLEPFRGGQQESAEHLEDE
jgi:hypothetical protein